jgi:hypothetical protein
MWPKYFLMFVLLVSAYSGVGQSKHKKHDVKKECCEIDQNFCNTLFFLKSSFEYNLKGLIGKKLEATKTYTRYVSLGKITGVDSGCIVHDTGWHYEGILYQDTSKLQLAEFYDEYRSQLRNCLEHCGYVLTYDINDDDSLGNYLGIIYKSEKGGKTIAMKVEHSKLYFRRGKTVQF